MIILNLAQVCGILIEIENSHALVGIGCNIYQTPDVPSSGDDAGRVATSLIEHCFSPLEADGAAVDSIGTAIFQSLSDWLDRSDSTDAVIREFEAKMSRSAQKLRGSHHGDMAERHVGTDVMPLRINPDGSLLVCSMYTAVLMLILIFPWLYFTLYAFSVYYWAQ